MVINVSEMVSFVNENQVAAGKCLMLIQSTMKLKYKLQTERTVSCKH